MPMPNGVQQNGHPTLKRPNENEFMHSTIKHMITSSYTFEAIQESAQYLLDRTIVRPKIGIICGSGLGSLADYVTQKQYFPYEEIPYFPVSTVKGHVGQMVFGYINGIPVMCMQGRFHHYEGYPLWKCSMPVRVMKLVGVTHLLVTNAAGGLNSKHKVGDIMLINDHVNMMGFAGNNPLQGPNDERFGPRFPSMTNAYDKNLIKICDKIIKEMKVEDIFHKGVYTCLGGPNYETVAEMRLLKMLGVDAIGMSTVHEVITACHCNVKVVAFSLITNLCTVCYDDDTDPNHEEVMTEAKKREPLINEFVQKLVMQMHKEILEENP